MNRLACFLLLAFGAACATMGRQKDDLQSTLDFFHHDLRWGYFQTAAAKVDPRHAEAFQRFLEKSEKDLKITDYEVRRVEISPDGKSARVLVRLAYYFMPSTVLKDETLEQLWEKGEGGWRLMEQKAGPFTFPPGSQEDEKTSPSEETSTDEP